MPGQEGNLHETQCSTAEIDERTETEAADDDAVSRDSRWIPRLYLRPLGFGRRFRDFRPVGGRFQEAQSYNAITANTPARFAKKTTVTPSPPRQPL